MSLIGFCLAFVAPFILLFELITEYLQQGTGQNTLSEKEVEGSESDQRTFSIIAT